jgi:hypothetical protein
MSEQLEQILAVFVLDDDVAARRFLDLLDGLQCCGHGRDPWSAGP